MERRSGLTADALTRHRAAGQVMLHPIAVAALIVLVVNDHVLKDLATSHNQLQGVTGKLSDVTGLIFFPLVLVALTDVAVRVADRDRPLLMRSREFRRVALTGSVLVTALGFSSIQVLSGAADAYTAGLELLRWLPSGVAAWLTGSPAPAAGSVNHVMDPADVLCLPAVAVSHRIGSRRLLLSSSPTKPVATIRQGSADG